MVLWNLWITYLLSLTTPIVCDFTTNDNLSAGEELGSGSKEVVEIQQTICKITTEQLVATAKATVTTALKGACSAKSVEEQLKRIERKLAEQNEFINSVMTKMDLTTSRESMKLVQKDETINKFGRTVDESVDLNSRINTITELYETASENIQFIESPREAEIIKYNCTVHKDKLKRRVFTYYWKLNRIKDILHDCNIITGPEFDVTQGGYRMKMRLVPAVHSNMFYLRVRLVHGLFDEALVWPFRLKHQMAILNQNNGKEDIISRICDPAVQCGEAHWRKPLASIDNYECSGLGIQNTTLKDKSFVLNDSIIFKLNIYLE